MQKKTVRQRYLLSEDNDGHWYLIPLENIDAWVAFNELDSENEDSWQVPQWARPLQGHPSIVTFENPSIVS